MIWLTTNNKTNEIIHWNLNAEISGKKTSILALAAIANMKTFQKDAYHPLANHMSQLQAGGLVIPSLTSSGQGQTRSEHTPGCYGNPVYYGDEYYFYFMGGHTSLTERWQALFSRYS